MFCLDNSVIRNGRILGIRFSTLAQCQQSRGEIPLYPALFVQNIRSRQQQPQFMIS